MSWLDAVWQLGPGTGAEDPGISCDFRPLAGFSGGLVSTRLKVRLDDLTFPN